MSDLLARDRRLINRRSGLLERSPIAPHQRGAAGEGFQAARRSTMTEFAIRVDADVADFAGGIRFPIVQPPVEDDGRANPCANDDVDHTAVTAPGPKVEIAERRRLGVVFKAYR